MAIAVCLIRKEPHYRRAAFEIGLRRAGYTLRDDTAVTPDDVLVIWNRYGSFAERADEFERRGARVLVVENGYYGDLNYAIAVSGHNGAGRWPIGDDDRLSNLDIKFKPWRTEGDHILVCLQRGIGPTATVQPPGWESAILRDLRKVTKRRIKVRQHPGRQAPAVSLADDLRNAWAMVTWASNAATEALIAGIPVHYCGHHIVTDGAAIRGIDSIENPILLERRAAFERLAWAQWSVKEIEQGEPFTHLRDKSC